MCRTKTIFYKDWMFPTIEVEFENYKIQAPKEYDKLLQSMYGDYMKLPPEEKRVSIHHFKAYWKE